MNEYELTVLFNEGKTTEWCENYLADLLTDKRYIFEDDGVKRLAYPVEGEEKARYVYVSKLFLTTMESNLLSETLYRKEGKDGVLRFLLVRVMKGAK